MSQDDNVKEVTKLEKTLIDKGRKDFVEEIRRMSNEDRLKRLSTLAKYRQEIISSAKADKELIAARERARELNKPYAEAKRANDQLSRFVALVLEEKGE